MRLILPVLALLLLTACGLKDDLYLPENAAAASTSGDPEAADAPSGASDNREDDDDAAHP